mmetsp:Transcript_17697/g.50669  ORF Transcript_17697/g.50669 Transcript_17697/m.50669 type:complete len:228 (-) Transcript_17697:122-805(-)
MRRRRASRKERSLQVRLRRNLPMERTRRCSSPNRKPAPSTGVMDVMRVIPRRRTASRIASRRRRIPSRRPPKSFPRNTSFPLWRRYARPTRSSTIRIRIRWPRRKALRSSRERKVRRSPLPTSPSRNNHQHQRKAERRRMRSRMTILVPPKMRSPPPPRKRKVMTRTRNSSMPRKTGSMSTRAPTPPRATRMLSLYEQHSSTIEGGIVVSSISAIRSKYSESNRRYM